MKLIGLELLKLRTQRAMTILLLVAFVFSILQFVAAAIAVNSANAFGFELSDRVVQRQFLTAGGGTLLVLVFAVMGITGEYRHRTITSTFLGTPERHRVILAKLGAYAIIVVGYGVVVASIVTAATLGLLSLKDVALVVTWDQILLDYVRDLAVMILYAGFGLGLGALVANQVAGIVIVLVEPIGSSILAGLLPDVGKWTLTQAATAFGQETDVAVFGGAVPGMLSRGSGGLVFLIYVVVSILAGIYVTRKRDIT